MKRTCTLVRQRHLDDGSCVWGDDAHLMLMHGAKPDAVMHTRKIQSHLQP